jgi:thioredoxin-dependent peroxiredoxin
MTVVSGLTDGHMTVAAERSEYQSSHRLTEEAFMQLRSIRNPFTAAALIALLATPAASGRAQQPAPAGPAPMVGPAVGEPAPDFDFLGITRYGVLKERHKLSDYHGKTIVLAFFPKARTKG